MPGLLHTRHRTLCTLVLAAGASLGLCRSSYAQGTPSGTVHSVTLTWTAPSPVGGSGTVAGYNIYRTPTTPLAYVKINAAPVLGFTLVDMNVAAGSSLDYCGTTVDSAGNESVCSIPITVVVPSNPAAPTGFAGSVK
jgi:hypothetical protein